MGQEKNNDATSRDKKNLDKTKTPKSVEDVFFRFDKERKAQIVFQFLSGDEALGFIRSASEKLQPSYNKTEPLYVRISTPEGLNTVYNSTSFGRITFVFDKWEQAQAFSTNIAGVGIYNVRDKKLNNKVRLGKRFNLGLQKKE